MFAFIVFIHVVVCLLLCIVILMQSGRGGGLTEAFASAESMFGAGTNTILVKATTVLATIFIVTSLGLAFFSSQKEKSLMSQVATEAPLTNVPTANIPPVTTAPGTPEPSTNVEPSSNPVSQPSTNAIIDSTKAGDNAETAADSPQPQQ